MAALELLIQRQLTRPTSTTPPITAHTSAATRATRTTRTTRKARQPIVPHQTRTRTRIRRRPAPPQPIPSAPVVLPDTDLGAHDADGFASIAHRAVLGGIGSAHDIVDEDVSEESDEYREEEEEEAEVRRNSMDGCMCVVDALMASVGTSRYAV